MSDSSVLKTITIIDYKTNQTVDVKVIYNGNTADAFPNIFSVDVIETLVGLAQQGNLVALVKNLTVIQLQVDTDGHLILFLTDNNENHYQINEIEAHLTYDKI